MTLIFIFLGSRSNKSGRSSQSKTIDFVQDDLDPGSPGSGRPVIQGEMYMRGQENETQNPIYNRRDSSAALF